jgi:hypothetical protein
LPEYEKNFTKALFRVHGSRVPDLESCPLFGGSLFTDFLCLTAKGYLTSGRLLSIVAYDYPNVEYCPFLPALTVLLLHHVGPDDVLGTCNLMLKRALADPSKWHYFPTYKRDIKSFNYAFASLVEKNLPKVWKHLEKLNDTDKPLWARWFCDLFIGILPLDIIFRIMDSYLVEGYKVLFRYGLALLETRSSAVLATTSWSDTKSLFRIQPVPSNTFLSTGSTHFNRPPNSLPSTPGNSPYQAPIVLSGLVSGPPSPEQISTSNIPSPISPKEPAQLNVGTLSALAFKYRFSKKTLVEARKLHQEAKAIHREGSLTDLFVGPNGTAVLQALNAVGLSAGLPQLLHSDASAFMTDAEWGSIWRWVPNRYRTCALELAFTTRKHGRSLATFYDLCCERAPSVLLVETMGGHVIGAYISEAWPSNAKEFNKFYGSGECMVFSLRPAPPVCYPWVHAGNRKALNGPPIPHSPITPSMLQTQVLPTKPSAETSNLSINQGVDQIDFKAEANTSSFVYAGNKEIIVGGGGGYVNSYFHGTFCCASILSFPLLTPALFVFFFFRSGQALWLSQDLSKGSTGSCATFDNKPLCNPTKFEISVVEVFSFRQL